MRRDDYPVTFTDTQWQRLQQAFPTGVCDYSKPGVNQQPTIPWLTYQDANGRVVYGGRPLGPAPQSVPFGPQETLPALLPAGCASGRALVLHLNAPRGQRLVSARIFVNGRRVRVIRGQRLSAPVSLTGLPRGRFTVRVTARTSTGRRLTIRHRYRACPSQVKRARRHVRGRGGRGRRHGRGAGRRR